MGSAALRAAAAAALAARSDVEGVTAVWRPPLISPMWFMRVTPRNTGPTQMSAGYMGVSPEYFAALGVQLRRGRTFSQAEAELEEMEKKWREENERIMREHPAVPPDETPSPPPKGPDELP